MGAPAALIAGAVLVTLSETRESMQPKKSEKRWIRLAKQWFRFLIVSDDDGYTPMILGMGRIICPLFSDACPYLLRSVAESEYAY